MFIHCPQRPEEDVRLIPQELDLGTVVCCHADAGNQTMHFLEGELALYCL